MSLVVPGKLEDLIDALPYAAPDPSPDQSKQTKTASLLVTNLAINQLNFLNVIVPQKFLQKIYILLF